MLSSAHHGAKEGLQTYTFESLSRLYNKKDQGCAKRDRRINDLLGPLEKGKKMVANIQLH